jgi:hypothetical protein
MLEDFMSPHRVLWEQWPQLDRVLEDDLAQVEKQVGEGASSHVLNTSMGKGFAWPFIKLGPYQ